MASSARPTSSGTREVGAGIAHHKRLVRQIYLDVRSQGNLDLLDDMFDSEYVGYDPTADPPVVRGPDGFREQTRGYRRVFPDLQFSIRSLVAEGDEVIVRWAATGTHRQSLMGEPPTGRRIETSGFGSWKFRNGKVVEHWGLIDMVGLREQLGVPMHPNEMLVRRFYQARAQDDREAIRACLNPDVAWHDPYPEPHGGDLRGVDAVFAQIFDAAGELTGGSGRLIPHDVLAKDEHAVALINWSTSLRGRLMQGREVAVFHVDSGLITEAWFYPEDPQAVAEFFG